MNRPTDIPEDVWEMARELLGEPDDYQRAARPKAIERIARAILAESEREMKVRVKELEWHNAPEAMADMQCEGIAAVGNNYVLTKLWHEQRGAEWCCLGYMYPTLEAAKSAAQADYEARILSALVQP